MTRPDRGEYRSVYVVILDGPDYQRLTPEARHVLLALKLTTGSAGIVVYPGAAHVLGERTGYDPAVVESALQELVASGWIERDANVIWVVRQLEFEPSLSRANANHRSWLEGHLAGLPRLGIVSRFRSHYADWLAGVDGTPHTMPMVSLGHPDNNHQIQPPPQPPDTTTTTRPAVDGMAKGVPYLTRCVVALNAGLRANPALTGFREISASEQTGRVTWEADGIPVDLAARIVREVATAYQPTPHNRQPSSLRYFDKAVRRAHEMAGQVAADTPSTSPKRAPRITA